MQNAKKIIIILWSIFLFHSAQAMVFDNRFLPLLRYPQLSVDGTQSEFSVNYMISTANKAFNQNQTDSRFELPDLFGSFDQVELAKSIVKTGKPNPLPSEFQGLATSIPWNRTGKIQMQGVNFFFDQQITHLLSTGVSWLFMRVNTRETFYLGRIEPAGLNTAGNQILLSDNRQSMINEIGICSANHASQVGFGDIDWYLRLGNMWEYTARFRRIDAGVSLGALMATGLKHELNEPTSIPFGGNGHWGIYGAVDGTFELREDWKVGGLLRVNKRFAKTQLQRMPAGKEPQPFGVVVGDARVNPGVTVIFQPYFLLEGLRAGLALGVDYSLIWHQKDSWKDERCNKAIPVDLQRVENESKWSAEYFTVNILYDLGKTKTKREFDPIITFRWDIPSSFFIANRVPNSNRVSLGLSFVY